MDTNKCPDCENITFEKLILPDNKYYDVCLKCGHKSDLQDICFKCKREDGLKKEHRDSHLHITCLLCGIEWDRDYKTGEIREFNG